jgi:hypothetical protein
LLYFYVVKKRNGGDWIGELGSITLPCLYVVKKRWKRLDWRSQINKLAFPLYCEKKGVDWITLVGSNVVKKVE